MMFAAETLTDPAALDAAAQVARTDFVTIAATAVISVLATSGLGGFFYWLWNRRKTNSEVDLNISEIDVNQAQINVDESVVIQNLVNVISGLQRDIGGEGGFLDKARELRDRVAVVEAEKRAADRQIEDVRDAEALKAKQVRQSFQAEKDKLHETVVRALDGTAKLDAAIAKCPNSNAIKRQSVMLVELLYYMKRLLES